MRRVAGLLLACAAAALAACQTAAPARSGPAEGPTAAIPSDSLDARLLAVRLSPDHAGLDGLRADMDATARVADLPRQERARVEGLAAQAALLAGDLTAARRSLASAAQLSDTEEQVWLARALMETDNVRRRGVLEQGIAKAVTTAHLLCERGELLLAAGRYAEAGQDLDEGLRGLPGDYAQLYGQDRDRALALAQAARDAGSAPLATAGLDAPLTVRSLVERTASGSGLLAGISPDGSGTFAALLPGLRSAGLLRDPGMAADTPVMRKDVAFFLWSLVSRAEHDPGLLTRYRQKYAASPVPDVAVTDPWFDAALGTVERGIMDLPDGVHFRPDDPVTGFELVAMLGQIRKSGLDR